MKSREVDSVGGAIKGYLEWIPFASVRIQYLT